MKELNGRVYNSNTMTWAYRDGSGLVTKEKQNQREQLRTWIDTLRLEFDGSIKKGALLAGAIFKYLTFNSD